MGLPIQNAPKFKCRLSDGREVTFRPFLVKEQKYLLIAKESSDNNEILDAVKNLVNAVTDGAVDTMTLPIYDLEYLFLNIRAKSVGESVDVSFYCGEEGCEGTGTTKVDLTSVEIVKPSEVDSKIMLSETLGVTLKFPNTSELAKAESMTDENEKLIELLMKGIDTIFDEESVYNTSEIPDSELKEFVENLTLEQLDGLNEFFESLPSVAKDVKYKCDTCGAVNETTLKGLQSFF